MSEEEQSRRDAHGETNLPGPASAEGDGPKDPSAERAERELAFTRRGLLQWSVPVVTAFALTDVAHAQQISPPHIDRHNDGFNDFQDVFDDCHGHIDLHNDGFLDGFQDIFNDLCP